MIGIQDALVADLIPSYGVVELQPIAIAGFLGDDDRRLARSRIGLAGNESAAGLLIDPARIEAVLDGNGFESVSRAEITALSRRLDRTARRFASAGESKPVISPGGSPSPRR